jgi:hypothetical protein
MHSAHISEMEIFIHIYTCCAFSCTMHCTAIAGEAEFRELSPAEAQLLRQACEPVQGSSSSSSAAAHPVSAFDGALLQGLYKRGLIYLEVPVAADDRISLPPLEVRVAYNTGVF